MCRPTAKLWLGLLCLFVLYPWCSWLVTRQVVLGDVLQICWDVTVGDRWHPKGLECCGGAGWGSHPALEGSPRLHRWGGIGLRRRCEGKGCVCSCVCVCMLGAGSGWLGNSVCVQVQLWARVVHCRPLEFLERVWREGPEWGRGVVRLEG